MNIDLAALMEAEYGFAEAEPGLVGREVGRRVREILAEAFMEEEDEAVFLLDFSRIEVIDYSCSDEILGKLIPRLLADEFGIIYLCLVNMSSAQIENVSAALEKKGLAVAAMTREGQFIFLGKLNPYLQEAFRLVYDHRRISARELSEHLCLALNTGSTRLLNLYKKRLVGRQGNLSTRGFREYIYFSLNGGFAFA